MIHLIQWPDLIVAVLLAEGLLYTLRAGLHLISRRNRNQHQQIISRIQSLHLGGQQGGALDDYRNRSKESVRAPLG